jgi:hypothetical protein
MEGKRRFTRIGCNRAATVATDNLLVIEVTIQNISLNGALLKLRESFTFYRKDRWRLSFRVPETDTTIKIRTEVVHAKGKMVGVKFIDLEGNILEQLRVAVETQAINPEIIMREYACLT